MMSASRSDRHWTNWSSGGIDETKPPMSPASFDRRDVDHHVPPGAVRGHRVTRLVDRHRVPLPVDVLAVVRQAVLLQLLRPR